MRLCYVRSRPQVDYLSRHYGTRCELKQMGERSKRYVHSVGGVIFSPVAALLALTASGKSHPNPDPKFAPNLNLNSDFNPDPTPPLTALLPLRSHHSSCGAALQLQATVVVELVL